MSTITTTLHSGQNAHVGAISSRAAYTIKAASGIPGRNGTSANTGDLTLSNTTITPTTNGNAVYITTGNTTANSTWSFDENGALNISGIGVLRGANNGNGPFNIVSNTYMQLQWSSDAGAIDPNANTALTNWMYVDQNGTHIENIKGTGVDQYYHSWNFDNAGQLVTPDSGTIKQNNSWTRASIASVTTDPAGVVVWSSSTNYISSVKLLIQVECAVDGDATGWHSQACEAIIASRGYANGINGYGEPHMVVYGIVHTSPDPLVAFTVRRNPTTNLIEVVGTLTAGITTAASLRLHSVEMSTRD